MHDVFVRVLEDDSCLKTVKSIAGYLCMIGRNSAIDYLRKQKRKKKKMKAILNERRMNEGHFYFDYMIVMKEFLKRLYERIESLPPSQRLMYRLNREAGLSREEIASALKISKNTVKEQM